jgi:hypothetical protein
MIDTSHWTARRLAFIPTHTYIGDRAFYSNRKYMFQVDPEQIPENPDTAKRIDVLMTGHHLPYVLKESIPYRDLRPIEPDDNEEAVTLLYRGEHT